MNRPVAILDDTFVRLMVKQSIPVHYLEFIAENGRVVCPPSVYDKEIEGKVPFLYKNFIDAFSKGWYDLLESFREQGESSESLEGRIANGASRVKCLLNKLGQHPAKEDLEVCAAGIVLSDYVETTLVSDDGDILFWFQILASVFGWKPRVLASVEWLGQIDRHYLSPVIETCFQHYQASVEAGTMNAESLGGNAARLKDGVRRFAQKAFSTCHPRLRSSEEIRRAA